MNGDDDMSDIIDDRFDLQLNREYEKLIDALCPYTGDADAYSLIWFSLCEIVMMSDMPIHNDTVGDIMTCIKGDNSGCNDFIHPLEHKSSDHEYNRVIEFYGFCDQLVTLGTTWKKAIVKSGFEAIHDLLMVYDIFTQKLAPFAYEKTIEWENRYFENELGDDNRKRREAKYSMYIKQMKHTKRELLNLLHAMETIEEFKQLND
jgi:hypothetical protein